MVVSKTGLFRKATVRSTLGGTFFAHQHYGATSRGRAMPNASLTVYSAKQFQHKYQPDTAEARRIITAVGETRADLDAFMTVYRNRRQAEHWLMDTAMPAAR